MSEYLPKEVRAGLELARKAQRRKTSRLNVKVGDQTFAILRYWEDGFSVDPDEAAGLRGFVDLYEGARHLSQCLIVASAEEAGEMVYEFKRATPALDHAPEDYERVGEVPVALIARD